MDRTVEFATDYVRRLVDHELDSLLPHLPAVLLDGPKGVGKTSTAQQRAKTVRELDDPAALSILRADPHLIETDPPPVLIDEWQRLPAVFDVVRRSVDANPVGGRFILTGSAIPVGRTHGGAGRITTIRMRPLTLHERRDLQPSVSFAALAAGSAKVAGKSHFGLIDYVEEIEAGGFPGLRGLPTRALNRRLDGYIDRIIEHDLEEAGRPVRRPATVRAWLTAYAASVGTTASWEKIRNAATPGTETKPAKTTVLPYIELLTQLRILDPVEAWQPSRNHLKTLTQAPVHHLADPALAVRLVRSSASRLTTGSGPQEVVPRDGTYLGALFESLVTQSVRVYTQRIDGRVYHLRTWAGRHEIDLVIELDDGIIALEVKMGNQVDDDDTRHLRWLREELGDELIDAAVIYTGPEAYRRKQDGIAVIPLALLGP